MKSAVAMISESHWQAIEKTRAGSSGWHGLWRSGELH
jgi:hypothetical protein